MNLNKNVLNESIIDEIHDFFNQNYPFVWISPMTNRSKRFLSDIPIETKNNSVMGIIDSVQIRSLDAKVRNFCKK